MKEVFVILAVSPVIIVLIPFLTVLALFYITAVYVIALPLITFCWLISNLFVLIIYITRGKFNEFTIKATPWMILEKIR